MSEPIRVLMVEDVPTDAGLNEREIRRVIPACEFRRVETREEFLTALEAFHPDIILSDFNLPQFDGMTALKLAQTRCPEIPFIIVTGAMNEDTAVDCMKAGSWDYVIKEHIKRLGSAVQNGLIKRQHHDEQKRAEEERQTFLELYHQSQKMESVGRLAGGVAHDFNNMLAIILGYVEIILEEVPPADPMLVYLKKIETAAQHSANLTRQLLAFARKQTVTPRILNINETVAGMMPMLQRLIGEDIQLVWESSPDLFLVNIDPSQVYQILANLIVNARDAIADVGKITIQTCNRAGKSGSLSDAISLSVSDNGCGMNLETQKKIFEPYFTTKEMGKGTGLGLATVHGIVAQNRGTISVMSEPGKGTTFHILFPRHDGLESPSDNASTTRPNSTVQRTILVVEDNSMLLELSHKMLLKLGYTVLTAETPGEALRLARLPTTHLDLLITDVVMPEMNGRDLSRQIALLFPKMKILFVSGYTADVIAHHGVLEEGVQFLSKPFSISNLARAIEKAMLETPASVQLTPPTSRVAIPGADLLEMKGS